MALYGFPFHSLIAQNFSRLKADFHSDGVPCCTAVCLFNIREINKDVQFDNENSRAESSRNYQFIVVKFWCNQVCPSEFGL